MAQHGHGHGHGGTGTDVHKDTRTQTLTHKDTRTHTDTNTNTDTLAPVHTDVTSGLVKSRETHVLSQLPPEIAQQAEEKVGEHEHIDTLTH